MRVASLGADRDGALVVVNSALNRYLPCVEFKTLQAALDQWEDANGVLRRLSHEVESSPEAKPLNLNECRAPLPRAYQWVDGSAYLSHMQRIRRAREASMPDTALTVPLVYQGGSDDLMGACADAIFEDEHAGIDVEAEVAVVIGDVPMGADADWVVRHDAIKLVMIANDWSLRNIIPKEVEKGFGFYQGKPSTAFSPVAVTPQSLGSAWNGRFLTASLEVTINGASLGKLNTGLDLQFDFPRLIEHCAKTRWLAAGTIVGSGTVSNSDESVGVACIAEKRAIEMIHGQQPLTAYLKHGDQISIDVVHQQRSLFGRIDQTVCIRPGLHSPKLYRS